MRIPGGFQPASRPTGRRADFDLLRRIVELEAEVEALQVENAAQATALAAAPLGLVLSATMPSPSVNCPVSVTTTIVTASAFTMLSGRWYRAQFRGRAVGPAGAASNPRFEIINLPGGTVDTYLHVNANFVIGEIAAVVQGDGASHTLAARLVNGAASAITVHTTMTSSFFTLEDLGAV